MDKQSEIIRFGNDGWKSRFDDDFTVDNVVRIADALGFLWSGLAPSAAAYVGYDTRHGSADFAREVAGVLASHGLRVFLSDCACPTPAIAWTCAREPESIGAVVITASELSCEYGGLIVRSHDGGPCPREFLDDVEREIPGTATNDRGAFTVCDLVSPYFGDLALQVDSSAISARAPKVVVDPMYGAASGHVQRLLAGLGCDAVQIHEAGPENFGGIHPAPTDPWADDCEQAVVDSGANLGILLDCDADRSAVVDETGRLVPARELIPLVLHQLAVGEGKTGRVVTTLTSSALIQKAAAELGLEYVPVSVGFGYIATEVVAGDVLLGSEEYGGVCVPSHLNERDGIYICLIVLELIAQSGHTLSELLAEQARILGTRFYARRDVRLDAATTQTFRNILPGLNPADVAGRIPVEVSHADGLRLQFEDGSWVLMRPSRNEPVVRVYAEALTAKDRDILLEAACTLVQSGPVF